MRWRPLSSAISASTPTPANTVSTPAQELDQEIIALTSELAQLKRERAKSEQRVSLLRTSRIDPDMLDERARYQLDYVNPHDLVRMIPAK
ncbi:cell division protein FtsB [Bradyrhizobium japonicum]